MNIWRDNYCLENDYDSKMKLSIIFSMLHLYGLTNLYTNQVVHEQKFKDFPRSTCQVSVGRGVLDFET